MVTGSPPLGGGRFLTPRRSGSSARRDGRHPDGDAALPRHVAGAIVAGRGFTAADDRGGPAVAIVNESFVRRYLPEGSPLGRTVKTLGAERLVVGVAGDIRALGREFPVRPEIDLPLGARASPRIAALVVRTTGDPAAVLSEVRLAVSAVLPGIAVRSIRTADEALARQIAQRRFNMLLLSLFGALGALLTGVGLFGTAAYGVERRTREIGVRRALGASSRAIVALVTRESAVVVLAGLGAGAGLSWLLRASVERFVFGVERPDAGAFALAVAAIVTATLAGCLLPARRATRVDPAAALRVE